MGRYVITRSPDPVIKTESVLWWSTVLAPSSPINDIAVVDVSTTPAYPPVYTRGWNPSGVFNML